MAHDRRTLEGVVDRYLAALAASDPSRLPVTPNVSFWENYQALNLGEGTWRTITGIGTYKHYFADPEAGAVGFIGTVRENGGGALLDLVLKTEGDRISAIESYIIRDALACARYEEMGEPEKVWLEAVPVAQRLSRAQMITEVNKYFEGMENNDGTGDYSFFDPECNRIEHALQTTNVKKPQAYGHSTDTDFSSMTAEQQWKTGFLGFVTEIRDRRFLVVDEERQAAFAGVTLDHNGTIREIPLTTGKTFVIPPYFDVPRTLQVMEGFKLRGPKLYRVEMTLTELPYGVRPPLRAAKRPRVVGIANAAGAKEMLGRVLAAMVARSSSGLPLAPNARYTENGQELRIGDGLWGTLTSYAGAHSAAPGYRVEVADDASGDAAFLGGSLETSTPGMLLLRVRMDGPLLAEIEAVVVRKEELGERGGTVTLFHPRLLCEFDPNAFKHAHRFSAEHTPRADLMRIADSYFDAIEKGSSAHAPLALACVKRDNGVHAANEPKAEPLDPSAPDYRPFALSVGEQIDSGFFKRIACVRERHHVADATHGLVLTIAVVDNPGAVKAFDLPGAGRVRYPGAPEDAQTTGGDQLFGARRGVNLIVPTSELMVQLTRVSHGKITEIETLVRGGPYGLSSGWM